MLKDPTKFRERFLRWKKGELVYENGLALPAYENGKLSDLQYINIMEKVAADNYKAWGFENEDLALIHALNDNTYDYRGYYNKYPNGDGNALNHWTDEFKTVYHPTFSNESIYSGKKSQYNPKGLKGGRWEYGLFGEKFIPAKWQRKPKYKDGLTPLKKSKINTNLATYVPDEDLYKSRYTLPEITVTGTNTTNKKEKPYWTTSRTKLLLPSELMAPLSVVGEAIDKVPVIGPAFNEYVAPALSVGNWVAGTGNPYKGAEIRANDERQLGAWIPLDFVGPKILGRTKTAASNYAVKKINPYLRKFNRDYDIKFGKPYDYNYDGGYYEKMTEHALNKKADRSVLGKLIAEDDLTKLKNRMPEWEQKESQLLSNASDSDLPYIKKIFKDFPEYEYYVLENSAEPLNNSTLLGFLRQQGKSTRGFHTSDQTLVQPNLTESYPMLRRFHNGGDRLGSDGGNYLSNSYELSNRFAHTLEPVENEVGYIGTQSYDFGIPTDLPIYDALRQYKNKIFNANHFLFNKKFAKATSNLDLTIKPEIIESEYVGRGNVKASNERAYLNNDKTNSNSREYIINQTKLRDAADNLWNEHQLRIKPIDDELLKISDQLINYAQFPKMLSAKNIKSYILDFFPDIKLELSNNPNAVNKYNTLKLLWEDAISRKKDAENYLSSLRKNVDEIRILGENILAPGKKVLHNEKLEKINNITEGHGRWDTTTRSPELFIPITFSEADIPFYKTYLDHGFFKGKGVERTYTDRAYERAKNYANLRNKVFHSHSFPMFIGEILNKLGYRANNQITPVNP